MKLHVNVKDFGSFTVALLPGIAPIACGKVVNVAKLGLYDGHRIERLEPGFVIQPLFCDGVDPVLDEEIELEAKTVPENGAIRFERGIVAMAGTATSASAAQYFVTLAPAERLNGNFTVIGKITEGWESIEKIESAKVVEGSVEENGQVFHYHYPEKDIVVESVRVTE